MIQWMLAIWSLVLLTFLNPAWTSGSSPFTYCWSLAWRIFEHYFVSVWDECNYVVLWAFFGISFLWEWNENWPFPVLWPLLSFPNLLAYWVQRLKQLNWNSITSLTLFVVMFPKAHLTSPSRMSGSRWAITPSWLSGSWRSFVYSSSVYSCHLFLISSASVRSIPFLSFIVPIFA